jgi:hypothetical protein
MAKARTGAQKPEVEKIMGQHHVFYFADGLLEKKISQKVSQKKCVAAPHLLLCRWSQHVFEKVITREISNKK